MSERAREVLVAAAVLALAGAGVAYGAGSDDVRAPADDRAAAPPFIESAAFCPPAPRDGDTRLALAATDGAGATAAIEPGDDEPTPMASRPLVLGRPPRGAAADAVGFGAPVHATAMVTVNGRVEGAGAARCSSLASDEWFFAAGSSDLGFDERIVVYNPFPEEAVVRLSFFTAAGERASANLADVSVDAGGSREIRINESVTLQENLGAKVTAIRGRVVAWREMVARPDDGVSGVEVSLGITAPARAWYFADGAAGRAATESIALLNPSDEEALVTIAITTADRTLEPRSELVEMPIAPGSLEVVPLFEKPPAALGDRTGVSAVVTSTNGVEVIAERTVVYDGERAGRSAEAGAPRPARAWLVGPAALSANDDEVALLNPGGNDARVTMSLLTPSTERAPDALASVRVPAGERTTVPLDRVAGGPAAVYVRSSAPIVAERSAYDSAAKDPAAVLGMPLP